MPRLCAYLGVHLSTSGYSLWRRSEDFRRQLKELARERNAEKPPPPSGKEPEAIRRLRAYRRLGTCQHLGNLLPGQPCGQYLRGCGHFGDVCTTHMQCRSANRICLECPEHTGRFLSGFPVRFDHHSLWPEVPGLRFNCSVIADGDGYLFAARNGWAGSEIHVGRLDREFKPQGPATRLHLTHGSQAGYGREDPRLFRFRGQLHVAYVGVHRTQRGGVFTSVLYARIGDGFRIEQIYYPQIHGRNGWEKNHSYFEHDGQLYAVYSIAPHRILRIDCSRAHWAYATPTILTWNGGEMRGGASPVRVGDEYWHFFHDRIVGGNAKRCYRTGLYTFEAKPPFAIKRYCPHPILTADPATNPGNYADVVFVGGAIREGDRWLLAHGQHDRFATIDAFSHAALERKLVPVESCASIPGSQQTA